MIVTIVSLLVMLVLFLVAIRGLGQGFKGLGGDLLGRFFAITENPFVGLVIGIFATSLMQSSSVTTSMVVALVAAPDHALPIHHAIPMIMGANIGTTVTNSIVALGHIGRKIEFRRAFAAATCHDFFNFIAVAVFLPLEMATGFLEKSSAVIADMFRAGATHESHGHFPNPIKAFTGGIISPTQHLLERMVANKRLAAVCLIALSMAVIFISLYLIVKSLKVVAATKMQRYVSKSLGATPVLGMIVGVVVTVMVQSSSITTSVLVPMAGAGIVTLSQVFPIMLGANVGTTFTAIFASVGADASTQHFAVQIAAVHLLFNVLGILMIYPIRRIRELPLKMATSLSVMAVRSRKIAIIYILCLFYILPALLIFGSRLFGSH